MLPAIFASAEHPLSLEWYTPQSKRRLLLSNPANFTPIYITLGSFDEQGSCTSLKRLRQTFDSIIQLLHLMDVINKVQYRTWRRLFKDCHAFRLLVLLLYD